MANHCPQSNSRCSSPLGQEFLCILVHMLAHSKGNQSGRIQECTFCMPRWLSAAVWCLHLRGLKSSHCHHTMQQEGLSCFPVHRREVWSARQIVWLEEGKPARSRASQKVKVFLIAAWNFSSVLRGGTEAITRDPDYALCPWACHRRIKKASLNNITDMVFVRKVQTGLTI